MPCAQVVEEAVTDDVLEEWQEEFGIAFFDELCPVLRSSRRPSRMILLTWR
jgi:hypothetical protein